MATRIAIVSLISFDFGTTQDETYFPANGSIQLIDAGIGCRMLSVVVDFSQVVPVTRHQYFSQRIISARYSEWRWDFWGLVRNNSLRTRNRPDLDMLSIRH